LTRLVSPSQLAQAQATDANLPDERHRAEELIATAAISKSNLDQHTSAAVASSANVEAARQATQAASDMVREAEAPRSCSVSVMPTPSSS
jgi:multidrug resistance efflux pump